MRPCDKPVSFNMTAPAKKPAPEPAPPATREVETVELVFGPRGRFAGFKRSVTLEEVK